LNVVVWVTVPSEFGTPLLNVSVTVVESPETVGLPVVPSLKVNVAVVVCVIGVPPGQLPGHGRRVGLGHVCTSVSRRTYRRRPPASWPPAVSETVALPGVPLTVHVVLGIESATVTFVAGPGFWIAIEPVTVQPESTAALLSTVTAYVNVADPPPATVTFCVLVTTFCTVQVKARVEARLGRLGDRETAVGERHRDRAGLLLVDEVGEVLIAAAVGLHHRRDRDAGRDGDRSRVVHVALDDRGCPCRRRRC